MEISVGMSPLSFSPTPRPCNCHIWSSFLMTDVMEVNSEFCSLPRFWPYIFGQDQTAKVKAKAKAKAKAKVPRPRPAYCKAKAKAKAKEILNSICSVFLCYINVL